MASEFSNQLKWKLVIHFSTAGVPALSNVGADVRRAWGFGSFRQGFSPIASSHYKSLWETPGATYVAYPQPTNHSMTIPWQYRKSEIQHLCFGRDWCG